MDLALGCSEGTDTCWIKHERKRKKPVYGTGAYCKKEGLLPFCIRFVNHL